MAPRFLTACGRAPGRGAAESAPLRAVRLRRRAWEPQPSAPEGLALLGAALRCGRWSPRSLTAWSRLAGRDAAGVCASSGCPPAQAGLEPQPSAPEGLAFLGAVLRCGGGSPSIAKWIPFRLTGAVGLGGHHDLQRARHRSGRGWPSGAP